MKKSNTLSARLLALTLALAAGAASADPTLAINSVLQRYPWSNTADIKYTVGGLTAGTAYYVSFYSVIDGVTNFAAEAVVDSTEANPHTLPWRVPEGTQARNCKMLGKIASAGLLTGGNEYMVVNLKTGAVAYEKLLDTQHYSDVRYNTETYKSEKMAFRRVPIGVYSIRDGANKAKMTNDYYIGVFEVTAAQYTLMNDKTASVSINGETLLPKNNVTWQTVRDSVTVPSTPSRGETLGSSSPIYKLNNTVNNSSIKFDLPTEAMWEVAARAMAKTNGLDAAAAAAAVANNKSWFFTNLTYTALSNLDTTNAVATLLAKYAWCCYNANTSFRDPGVIHEMEDDGYGHNETKTGPRVVGTKAPNQWGLFDMYGNVYEQCIDGIGDPYGTGDLNWSQTPFRARSDLPKKRRLRGGAYTSGVVDANSLQRTNDLNQLIDYDTLSLNGTNHGSKIGFRLSAIVPN